MGKKKINENKIDLCDLILNIVPMEELWEVKGLVRYLGKCDPRRLSNIHVFKQQKRG